MEPLYPVFSASSLQQKNEVKEQDLALQSQKNHRRIKYLSKVRLVLGTTFTIKLLLAGKISSKVAC